MCCGKAARAVNPTVREGAVQKAASRKTTSETQNQKIQKFESKVV